MCVFTLQHQCQFKLHCRISVTIVISIIKMDCYHTSIRVQQLAKKCQQLAQLYYKMLYNTKAWHILVTISGLLQVP